MFSPFFAGDPRHHSNFDPVPGWFTRDMGDRIHATQLRRRWRLPIWPGFRLELRILPVSGVKRV